MSQSHKVKHVEWIPGIKYIQEDENMFGLNTICLFKSFLPHIYQLLSVCALSFGYVASPSMLGDEILLFSCDLQCSVS